MSYDHYTVAGVSSRVRSSGGHNDQKQPRTVYRTLESYRVVIWFAHQSTTLLRQLLYSNPSYNSLDNDQLTMTHRYATRKLSSAFAGLRNQPKFAENDMNAALYTRRVHLVQHSNIAMLAFKPIRHYSMVSRS